MRHSLHVLLAVLLVGLIFFPGAHVVWNLFLAPMMGWKVLAWWQPGAVWVIFINALRAIGNVLRGPSE